MSTEPSGGGGGLYSFEAVSLTNSTVSGNSTTGASAGGGGLSGERIYMENSTVSGNTTAGADAAGGGISGTQITLDLFDIRNSIVAGNAATGSTDPDIAGVITGSNGHNVFGSDVAGNIVGDLENVPASLLLAGGLADNGGPTQTIALRDAPDNPALAGADPADTPATDQRGEVRPQPAGTAPDIGAFELNQAAVAPNEIVGTDRGEFLSGTSGPDLIRGLGGNDRLWGRPGDDALFGDAGKDVLAGKAGIDQTTGGGGADRFLFRRVADAPADGPGYDEILDFRRAQHDRIDLRPIDAKVGAEGNQKFCFIGDDPFTRAGQLRFEATADGDFLVSGNVDRDLDADFAFIVRTDLVGLKAGDFLL